MGRFVIDAAHLRALLADALLCRVLRQYRAVA
jgi:hypothetical protein